MDHLPSEEVKSQQGQISQLTVHSGHSLIYPTHLLPVNLVGHLGGIWAGTLATCGLIALSPNMHLSLQAAHLNFVLDSEEV